jgi:tetratricopeptide (TPR) repeat protein
MVLNHYPDPAKSRSSYHPLLELAVQEDPQSARMRYYLGREYMYMSEWQKCIETLRAFLLLPTATWIEERCAAMRWIAKSFYSLRRIQDAYAWYYKAVAEAPHLRDPLVEFARMCYELKDWPMCFFLTKEALKIREKSKVYVNMGYSWDATPDDLCSIAAFRLGLRGEACEHAEKALAIDPQNVRLQNNLALLNNLKEQGS